MKMLQFFLEELATRVAIYLNILLEKFDCEYWTPSVLNIGDDKCQKAYVDLSAKSRCCKVYSLRILQ